MKLNNLVVTLIAVWVSGSAAFAPLNAPKSHLPTTKVQLPEHSLLAQKGDEQAATSFSSTRTTNNSNALAPIAAATALGVLFTAEPAQAADLFPIKSALAAYVHYLSLVSQSAARRICDRYSSKWHPSTLPDMSGSPTYHSESSFSQFYLSLILVRHT